ncbi:hypothetical protein AWZ03_007508 [Drosophila navojoa]|uniref:Uncharacterized protein n=1 Tax=Drosophila navojoa TaxID=7232 RepID=A0A484BBI6_DRONA|nr:hypothetical protein AWZ03_007508 [Drosophila navojoa]
MNEFGSESTITGTANGNRQSAVGSGQREPCPSLVGSYPSQHSGSQEPAVSCPQSAVTSSSSSSYVMSSVAFSRCQSE